MDIKTFDTKDNSKWLPQVEADFGYVKKQLDKDGVSYRNIRVNPKELIPLKKSVKKSNVDLFEDLISKDEPIDNIYIDVDGHILDGHNRAYAFMQNKDIDLVECFQILLPYQDACRVLNKTQDIYDYEKNFNVDNDSLLSFDNVFSEEDISKEENDLNFEDVNKNPTELTLYKSKEINKKAKTGDFLITTKKPHFNHEYVIGFENLLEIPQEDLEGFDLPTEAIATKWFKDKNFKDEATKQALTYEVYLSRLVNQKAEQMGYDGIKYGDNIVQIINI